jgi:NTE family protein
MINYDTICLSGGGVKGFSFIGALKYLEGINYINILNINNFIGTSAGAIASLFLSLGYTCLEIETFILEFDFNKIQPDVNIDNLLLNFGIDNGEKITLLLQEFIEYKFNVKDLTFEEHHKLTKNKLSIIGTNYSKSTEVIFNYETKPKMSIITAVRISCAIPIIFMPILFEEDYYIDGGLVNNFPLKYCNSNTTLGIYIKYSACNKLDNIISLLMGALSIMSDTVSTKDCKNNNVIEIENYHQEFVRFDLTLEDKIKMIDLGVIFTKKYIDNIKIQELNNIKLLDINIDSEEELLQNKFN